MKVNSKNIDGRIVFENFVVIKKSENFFEVYENYMYYSAISCGPPITSGTSLNNACKKAKLLQIGYNIANDKQHQSMYEYLLDREI